MLKIIREAVETITGCDTNKVTRVREYVQARAMYYHFARKSGATLTAIGKSNGKDHATIIHGLKKFEEYHNYDDVFRKQYTQLQELLIDIHINKEETASENISEALRLKNEALVQRNIILQQKLSKASLDKPQVMEDMLEGIPQERIEFFINNQLASFIKMERATLNKLKEYEDRNQQIREQQAFEQASLKEEGGRIGDPFKQPTYLSNQFSS
jgi:hypothetical protein